MPLNFNKVHHYHGLEVHVALSDLSTYMVTLDEAHPQCRWIATRRGFTVGECEVVRLGSGLLTIEAAVALCNEVVAERQEKAL